MSKLKISNRKLIEVSDWDELVEETYKKCYSFQQDGCQDRGLVSITIPSENIEEEEEMNDDIPWEVNGEKIGVKFSTWLNKEYKHGNWKDDLIWERNFYPNLQTIANDLHSKGLIEAGDYSIDIDW